MLVLHNKLTNFDVPRLLYTYGSGGKVVSPTHGPGSLGNVG
jgi:hypothetical protein